MLSSHLMYGNKVVGFSYIDNAGNNIRNDRFAETLSLLPVDTELPLWVGNGISSAILCRIKF
jgi:hypothetical protein